MRVFTQFAAVHRCTILTCYKFNNTKRAVTSSRYSGQLSLETFYYIVYPFIHQRWPGDQSSILAKIASKILPKPLPVLENVQENNSALWAACGACRGWERPCDVSATNWTIPSSTLFPSFSWEIIRSVAIHTPYSL